jgi:hypothetical protein
VIVPKVPKAGEGSTVIAWQLAKLMPHAFPAVTQMFPETDPKFTLMAVVPCPVVMKVPAGEVQVYAVAF